MNELRFILRIPAETFNRYYAGRARSIVARTIDGRHVRFSARHLQRFVTHEGVHGEFLLRYDHECRFLSLERINDLNKRG